MCSVSKPLDVLGVSEGCTGILTSHPDLYPQKGIVSDDEHPFSGFAPQYQEHLADCITSEMGRVDLTTLVTLNDG